MRKFQSIALGLLSVLVLAGASTAAVAANADNPQAEKTGDVSAQALACKRQSAANSLGQDIFLSTPNPRTYPNASSAWQNVECASTTFRLKAGQRALIASNFNAESDCNGSSPTNGQWCQTRALLNGFEGSPVAAEPSSFAFDSVAGGVFNWQANSMARAWEVTCPSTSTNGCGYRYQVQTRMHDASVTGMWLDEIAAHIHITYGAPAPL